MPCARIGGMRKMSVTISTFSEIVEKGILYVDKTRYIYDMVTDRDIKFYFVSRPRRYGKSLMCSTLRSLFEGDRGLFEGLYIAGTDYDFRKYPVLYFDFSAGSTTSIGDFVMGFQDKLLGIAGRNGIEVGRREPSLMMEEILMRLEGQAVVIIDEFDSPITSMNVLSNRELAEGIRQVFNDFYKVVKANGGKIRFFFMTGVTKLSHMSIFSAMNNLVDLTMDAGYAGMFGFPNKEISTTFVQALARAYSEMGRRSIGYGIIAGEAREAVRRGDTERLIELLGAFYAQCSNRIINARLEKPYHIIFHMFFVAAGCKPSAEDAGLKGTGDEVMEVGGNIYIAELKVDGNPDVALRQIKENRYYEKLILEARESGKNIYMLGINFSSKERCIESWVCEKLEI